MHQDGVRALLLARVAVVVAKESLGGLGCVQAGQVWQTYIGSP
jgi:hypothetical protein